MAFSRASSAPNHQEVTFWLNWFHVVVFRISMALSGSKSRRSGSRNRNSAISKGTSCTESTVMIDKPSSRGRSRSLGGSRKRSGVSITNSLINDDNAPQSRGNSKSRVTASGGGMTIWWITAVCLTLFLRFEQTARKEIFKWNVESSVLDVILSWLIRTSKGETPSEIALSLLRGVCCVTGLAVGVGYYTFKVCFRYVQGSMSRQLYDHHDLNKLMSYPVFLVLDIATHIGVVCAITLKVWIKS